MDYERIHKAQMGVISPTKLRMKLLGVHKSRKESGSNSSRASPSKLEELKSAKNGLLANDHHEEASSEDSKGSAISTITNLEAAIDSDDKRLIRSQSIPKDSPSEVHTDCNLSNVHPLRSPEEDCYGYDSGRDNASTSSFEFHRGERVLQSPAVGPFSRHVPSKWNDAEKWIVSRQMHPNASKKNVGQNQGIRPVNSNCVRVAPEHIVSEQKSLVFQTADAKRIAPVNYFSQTAVEKFCFVPQCSKSNLGTANATSAYSSPNDDAGTTPRLRIESNHKGLLPPSKSSGETTAIPAVQSVSMRDIGTEMTPVPSQDPSRTGTPLGATTPILSPFSSIPSTPKRGAPAPSPVGPGTDDESDCQKKINETELSENELQMKARREIAALGIQLGKMNIASWASKNGSVCFSPAEKTADEDRKQRSYELRAAAWEEAEKSKHMARFRRKEVKIQAWEARQKAKFEDGMRKVEAQVEELKACAQEKMVERVALTRRRVEEKLAAIEFKKNMEAARTVKQVEQIRRTGRVPSSHLCCFTWFH